MLVSKIMLGHGGMENGKHGDKTRVVASSRFSLYCTFILVSQSHCLLVHRAGRFSILCTFCCEQKLNKNFSESEKARKEDGYCPF